MNRRAMITAQQKVQSGTTGTQGDRIDRILWDELVIAAAPLRNRLFVNPLSSGGKLLDQTNNTEGGRIPANKKFFVHAICIDWVTENAAAIIATAADIQAFYTQLARTTAELSVNNREFGQWTLQRMFGACMLCAVNPAVTFHPPFVTPEFKGIVPLNRMIPLAGNTQFFVEVVHSVIPTAATIGDRLRIGLMGVEIRIN